jgi:hypothetical protein
VKRNNKKNTQKKEESSIKNSPEPNGRVAQSNQRHKGSVFRLIVDMLK